MQILIEKKFKNLLPEDNNAMNVYFFFEKLISIMNKSSSFEESHKKSKNLFLHLNMIYLLIPENKRTKLCV